MVVEKGYKQTEVGVIPEDWEVKSVKILTEFHKQGYYTTENYKENGRYYLLRGTDMQNPNIDYNTTPKINANFNDFNSYKVLAGDFLFVRSGAIGRYGIAKENLPNSIFGSYLINFRFKSGLNTNYFGYFYQSNLAVSQLLGITQGGGNLNINAENIKALRIPIPTLPEQAAIATALSDMDALIAQTEKLIEKKKAIKQGVMQVLLKPREGWVTKKFTDVVNYIHGKAHEQFIVDDGDYEVVNSKFISSNGNVKKYSNHSFLSARIGDVLTVLSDLPNGKALAKCFFVESNNKYAVNQRVCIWRSLGAYPKFLFYILNRHPFFLSLDDGVSQTHILNSHIEKFYLTIPDDVNEQKSIADTIWDIDKNISAIENKLQKLKLQKQGMMQALLTGKIRLIK